MDKVKEIVKLKIHGLETPTVKIIFKDDKTHSDCLTVAIGEIILGSKIINIWLKSDLIKPTKIATMIDRQTAVMVEEKYFTLEKKLKDSLSRKDLGQIFEYLFDNFETLFSE